MRGTFRYNHFVVQTFAIFSLVCCSIPAYAQDTNTVLKVYRKSAFTGGSCGMDVYVNDIKLGSVDNGSTKEFKFAPQRDGRNKIYVEMVNVLGFRTGTKSATKELIAKPGDTVNATTTLETGFVTNTLHLQFTVVKKE